MSEFNFSISHQDIFPNITSEQNLDLSVRPTVRGVIFDENQAVCIRTKKGSGFYFLPGGGVGDGEGPVEALKRECLEEAGSNITNIQKVGEVIEYRNEANEKRTNECFTANLIGEKLEPTLAIGDEDGFDVIWVDISEAITVLENQKNMISSSTDNFYTRAFNTERDLRILRYLSSN